VIKGLFMDETWDHYYQEWVKIFRKSEVIKANKIPRMIWAVGMLSIIVDSILFTPTMKAHKNQFERGYSHGITPKGGGFAYMLERITGYYVKLFDVPQNVPVRDAFKKFLRDDGCDDKALFQHIARTLFACDDDVIAWDFCQYMISFEMFNMCVAHAYGINPFCMSASDAIYLFLIGYSSHFQSAGLVNIKKEGESDEEATFVIRMLKSGELLTAHKGSQIHSQVRHTLNVRKYLMLRSIQRKLDALRTENCPPNVNLVFMKLVIGLALISTPGIHHSDDFFDLVINLSIPAHALFDTVFNYTREGLALKHEPGAPHRKDLKGIDFEFMHSLIDPDLIIAYGLDKGTPDGSEFKTSHLFNSVMLYDARKRYSASFKTIYTVFNPDGSVLSAGGQFLQFMFELVENVKRYVMVRRGRERLYAKFLGRPARELTPAQLVARIRSYAYLAIGQPDVHEVFRRVELNYRARIGMSDSDLATMLVADSSIVLDEFRYNVGGLELGQISEFPSYSQVFQFYTPEVDVTWMIKNRHMKRLCAPPPDYHYIHVGDTGSIRPMVYTDPIAPKETMDKLKKLRAQLGPQKFGV